MSMSMVIIPIKLHVHHPPHLPTYICFPLCPLSIQALPMPTICFILISAHILLWFHFETDLIYLGILK